MSSILFKIFISHDGLVYFSHNLLHTQAELPQNHHTITAIHHRYIQVSEIYHAFAAVQCKFMANSLQVLGCDPTQEGNHCLGSWFMDQNHFWQK